MVLGETGKYITVYWDCYYFDVRDQISVSMQRFIEKNKSIQETPQHHCVSVDVRNNEKVKY